MGSTVTASFLFTDLVDSTAIATRLGEDDAEKLRRSHYAVLRDAIHVSGGTEVKSTGDGVMVVLSSATDALRCAVAMQQGIERYNRTASEALGLRIGVTVGDAEAQDGDYYGTTVVEAARLCAAAQGGEILISELLQAMVGSRGAYRYRALGPLELKGLGAAVPAYALDWEPLPSLGDADVPLPLRLARDGSRFVGRAPELEVLEGVLKAAGAGTQALVLVSGEPGIGKTRLVTEAARRAHDQGAIVLYGRCDEDLGIPYQPIIEALSHLVHHAPDDVIREHVEEHGGELARLVGELGRRVPDVPAPRSGQAEGERYLLFAACAGLLRRASLDAPIVMVVDDLHWVDEPTLLLLKYLVISDSSIPLLVLGTYRATEVPGNRLLADLLASLRREQGVTRLELDGLADVELVELIECSAGHALDELGAGFARMLHRETHGNPFFAGELVRHLDESGAIQRIADGRWALPDDPTELHLPQSVREVVGQRVSRLSPDANRMLSVAAVAGNEFQYGLLRRVPDAAPNEEVLLEALDEAVAAGLLIEVPESDLAYRFSHALVRKSVYGGLSSARRDRLHWRIGEALEHLLGRSGDVLPTLAYHYTKAAPLGFATEAADFSLLAGHRALAQLASEDAVAHFEQGLRVLEPLEPPDLARRCDLLLGIAAAKGWEDFEGSNRAAQQAALDAQALGSPERLARAAIEFARFGRPGATNAVENARLYERALAGLGTAHDALRAQVLAIIAFSDAIGGGRGTDTDGLAQEALALARRSGDDDALAHALGARATTIWGSPDVGLRLELGNELLDRSRRAGDLRHLAEGRSIRLLALLELGDVAGFRQEAEEVRRLGEETQNQFLVAHADLWSGTSALLAGRLDQAEECLERSTGRGASRVELVVGHLAQTFFLRREQARLAELRAVAAAPIGPDPNLVILKAAAALMLCDLDERETAAELVRDITGAGCDALPRDFLWTGSMALLAETCAYLNDQESAAQIRDLLLPHRGHLVVVAWGVACVGAVDRFLGMTAATCADLDAAEWHYRAALELEATIDAPPLVARTSVWLARALLQRPGSDARAAANVLSSAEDVAARCGMAQIAAEIRDLQARL